MFLLLQCLSKNINTCIFEQQGTETILNYTFFWFTSNILKSLYLFVSSKINRDISLQLLIVYEVSLIKFFIHISDKFPIKNNIKHENFFENFNFC